MPYNDGDRSFYHSIQWQYPVTPDKPTDTPLSRPCEFIAACWEETHVPQFAYPFDHKRFEESLNALQNIYSNENSEAGLSQKVIQYYIECYAALDRKFTFISAVNTLAIPAFTGLLVSYRNAGPNPLLFYISLVLSLVAFYFIVLNLAAALHNARMDYYDLTVLTEGEAAPAYRTRANIIPCFFQLRHEMAVRYERAVQRSYRILLIVAVIFVMRLGDWIYLVMHNG